MIASAPGLPVPLTVPALMRALHAEHRRYVDLVGDLTESEVRGPTYASEWTVADLCSHLGSGAEIHAATLAAGLRGEAAPGMEAAQAVWAVWDAKAPMDQVNDSITANEELLAALDALTEEQAASWHMELFNGPNTLPTYLRMRLAEVALHVWDLEVIDRPDVTLDADSAALIMATFPVSAGRMARGEHADLELLIELTDPASRWVLTSTGGEVSLVPASTESPATTARLALSTEAFVRLFWGRLDAAHTPTFVIAEGVDLDDLRRMYPGF